MKQKILIIIVFTILISSCFNEQKLNIKLDNLLADWTSLTKRDGKFIIYNSCDGGNSIVSIVKKMDSFFIVIHGGQEDDFLLIKEAYKKESDTIYFRTIYQGSNIENIQKLILFDTTKSLAKWKLNYLDVNYELICVNSKRQNQFDIINQPCRECFDDDVCDDYEKNDSLKKIETPVETIKRIFDEYVEFSEGTDSEENKADAKKAFTKITKLKDYKDFETLLNFWMYYDPTDFSIREELIAILKNNKPQSIEAIKTRLKNKRSKENIEYAPYIDLEHLLEEIVEK
jgi:hypothetical protein